MAWTEHPSWQAGKTTVGKSGLCHIFRGRCQDTYVALLKFFLINWHQITKQMNSRLMRESNVKRNHKTYIAVWKSLQRCVPGMWGGLALTYGELVQWVCNESSPKDPHWASCSFLRHLEHLTMFCMCLENTKGNLIFRLRTGSILR